MAECYFNETDYAWAAGFLDGEGTFGLYTNKGKSLHPSTRRAIVCASQSDEIPILRLEELFGGLTRKVNTLTQFGTQLYRWEVTSGPTVVYAIKCILPYLILKRKEAESVLEYAKTIGTFKRGIKPPKEFLDYRFNLIATYDLAKGN